MIEPAKPKAVAVVFLTAVALFFASSVRQVSDSYYSLLLAQQIATHGTLDLAEHFTGELPLDRFPGNRFEGLPYHVRRRGDAVLTEFPLGAPLLAAPWMGVAASLGIGVLDADGRYDRERERRHQRLLAALGAALFVAGAFVAARRRLSRRAALWSVAALAFATPVWSTASRGWWSHTAALVLLGLALPLAVGGRRDGPAVDRPALLGALLAGAYVCRPTTAIALALAGAALLVADRRAALRLAAGALPVLAGLVVVSWASWGTLLPPYYLSSRLGGPTLERLAGVLVSPSRGLLVFEPALAVALAYGAARWRRLEGRAFFGLGAAGLALHTLAVAGFPHWWGGHAYGPRLFTETVAYQALVAVPVVATLLAAGTADRRWRRALVATVLLGVVIHAGGALSNQGNRWNWSPVEVDEHPERLWDWSDPQGFAWLNRRPRAPRPEAPAR